jgi:multiple sugar transport system permease protein
MPAGPVTLHEGTRGATRPDRFRGPGGRVPRWLGRSTYAQQRRSAALLLSPALIVLVPFVFVPIALTFWISLHYWSMLTPLTSMKWAGLANYQALLHSPDFRGALVNTLIYVGLVLVITVPLSLLLGMLLYFPRARGRGLARTVLFSAYVIPTVAVAIVWNALYAPNYGPFARMFQFAGLPAPAFLSSPSTALVSLVAFNVWQMLGYYTVLVVAGLTQIPGELYEAARIDGAGLWRQTFSITLPLLRGTTVFVVLMTIINSVQVFDPVYILTQGGPVNSTNVISFDIQRTAFEYGFAGSASAMAFSLLVVLAAFVAIILRALRRRV